MEYEATTQWTVQGPLAGNLGLPCIRWDIYQSLLDVDGDDKHRSLIRSKFRSAGKEISCQTRSNASPTAPIFLRAQKTPGERAFLENILDYRLIPGLREVRTPCGAWIF